MYATKVVVVFCHNRILPYFRENVNDPNGALTFHA